MRRPRAVFALSLGAAAVAALLLHSCGGSPPSGFIADGGEGDAPLSESGMIIDSSMFWDGGGKDGGGDAETADAGDANWIDGEYCPSAAWPPRTDGCPCDPGRSGLSCREEILGKVCDYYTASCPPGPAYRFTCVWKRPKEAPAYLGWEDLAIPCDTKNDAGPGG